MKANLWDAKEMATLSLFGFPPMVASLLVDRLQAATELPTMRPNGFVSPVSILPQSASPGIFSIFWGAEQIQMERSVCRVEGGVCVGLSSVILREPN